MVSPPNLEVRQLIRGRQFWWCRLSEIVLSWRSPRGPFLLSYDCTSGPSRLLRMLLDSQASPAASPLNVTTASHWLGSSWPSSTVSNALVAGLRWEVRVALMGFDLL